MDFHDYLVSAVVDGEQLGIYDEQVSLRSPAHAKAFQASDDPWQWLRENGYDDAICQITYKQIVVAVVSDFCHFVFEALHAALAGKLAVAFALLRKPFKENLFFLEWLLADPRDLLARFRSGVIGDLVISKAALPPRRRELIVSAMKTTAAGTWIDPTFIDELRYCKTAEHSLEHFWVKATHLITTLGRLKTEPENLNFVFSGDEERAVQWRVFYSTVPVILFHAVEVVEALLGTIAEHKQPQTQFSRLSRACGLLLWIRLSPLRSDNSSLGDALRGHCLDDVNCPDCGDPLFPNSASLLRLYQCGALRCNRCRVTMPLAAVSELP